jgi:hypothetical protein
VIHSPFIPLVAADTPPNIVGYIIQLLAVHIAFPTRPSSTSTASTAGTATAATTISQNLLDPTSPTF